MAGLTEALQEESRQRAKEAKEMARGIVLIMDKADLTADSIMQSLEKSKEIKEFNKREKLYKKTGDISYSYANISVEELHKKGKVEKIDAPY